MLMWATLVEYSFIFDLVCFTLVPNTEIDIRYVLNDAFDHTTFL